VETYRSPFAGFFPNLLRRAAYPLLLLVVPFTASAQSRPIPVAADLIHPAGYRAAESALMLGRLDDAVAKLQPLIAATPKDPTPRLLLCRAYYAEELVDPAVTACEAALQQAPDNPARRAEIEDWLGRAYGLKADHAGPIAGFKLAHQVKSAFESAVEHDPANGDAVNDLSEYYINAPALVGGGPEKADALADRSFAKLPQQAHRIRALAAEHRHDFDAAEREFRAAVAVANHPDAWVDLGNYYKRRNQLDKSVDALRHALAADRDHDASIVDVASILHDMHRESALAQQTLRLYLAGNAQSDAAPAVRVHVLLARLLAEAGDKPGAKIELNAALTLAQNYRPAKRALQELQP
jgi:tetratricopeptide (TPR) repeat protein